MNTDRCNSSRRLTMSVSFPSLRPITASSPDDGSGKHEPEVAEVEKHCQSDAENATDQETDPNAVPGIPRRSPWRIRLLVRATAHAFMLVHPEIPE